MKKLHSRNFFSTILTIGLLWLASCSTTTKETAAQTSGTDSTEAGSTKAGERAVAEPAVATGDSVATPRKTADAAVIYSRQQVPILCYHQVRDWRPKDSRSAKDYIVPVELFRQQIKMLADSGYHSILPDQLYAYLTTGAPLPPKPILFTFDDGDLDQYERAAPELEKYGFRGVFFIMTVAIGRRGYQPYMDSNQIRELSERGHVIGGHTWDHHNVKKYQGKDWITQLEKPNKRLEQITGKPVRYFAYPFGLWNQEAFPELRKHGYLAAFQLSGKRDSLDPLMTIRRIIASGYWSPKTLHNSMVNTFQLKKTAPPLARN